MIDKWTLSPDVAYTANTGLTERRWISASQEESAKPSCFLYPKSAVVSNQNNEVEEEAASSPGTGGVTSCIRRTRARGA